MGALCMLMAWLGYQFEPLQWVMRDWVRPLSQPRMLSAAYVTMTISLFASYWINQIPREEIETGTGLFTILAFFAGFAVIAFPIFLVQVFRSPGLTNLILADVRLPNLFCNAFLRT